MKIFKNKKISLVFSVIILFQIILLLPSRVAGAEVNLITQNDTPSIDLFMTPQTGSFLGGTSFEVPFFINTKGKSVTNIDLNISYDPTRLGIIKPSNGKSVIGIWASAPGYDNNKGTANFSGTIPNGIVSESGLITSITFEAKAPGNAEVIISESSKVEILDGKKITPKLITNRGLYTIFPRPTGSVEVYSETHPFEDKWSSNPNVIFIWNKIPNIIGYSFVLDNKPNTLPENKVSTTDTVNKYENLSDGVWYFHIKALKDGDIWGTTTNRILKIDTTPPNNFKPKIEYIRHGNSNLASISFATTDSLSGVNHYEVGLTDTSNNLNNDTSPVFNYAESPYQVSLDSINSARVTVRAIDNAGNITDSAVYVKKSNLVWQFVYNNKITILVLTVILLILIYVTHYFKDHRVFKRLRMLDRLIKAEDQKLEKEEMKNEAEEQEILEHISKE